MTTNLTETTIRDFGGGWNVSDSDKSLTSKYQTISDNIVRQTDGSFSIRPGTRLFADLKQGTETTVNNEVVAVTTSANSGWMKIVKTAHGLTSGKHINITAWSVAVGDCPRCCFCDRQSRCKIDDANTIGYMSESQALLWLPVLSTVTMSYSEDTHMIGGRDIFGRYYKDYLFVFT